VQRATQGVDTILKSSCTLHQYNGFHLHIIKCACNLTHLNRVQLVYISETGWYLLL